MSKLKLFGTTSHSFIQAAPTSSGETFTLPGEGASNPGLGGMYLSTPQAANSASILFDDVPVWASKIIIMFGDVDMPSEHPKIKLGTSSNIISTGYVETSTNDGGGGQTNFTDSFGFFNNASNAGFSGIMTIVKFSSTEYTEFHAGRFQGTGASHGGGYLSGVSETITRVEITLSGGGSFTSGKINIRYEA